MSGGDAAVGLVGPRIVDGDANRADLALLAQLQHRLVPLALLVPVRGPGMELVEVEAIGLQVAQADLAALDNVPRWVLILNIGDAGRSVPVQVYRRHFGGDRHALAAPLEDAGDHALALPVAVVLRRVDQATAEVERAVQRRDRLVLPL